VIDPLHLLAPELPPIVYQGAIERTTTNIWNEHEKKSFLIVDPWHAGAPEVHTIPTRPMFDLEKLNAQGWGAGLIFQQIALLLQANAVPSTAIVRQVVVNVPREVLRELPWKEINELRAHFQHYQLDVWPRKWSRDRRSARRAAPHARSGDRSLHPQQVHAQAARH
jgi:hypothetical protein